MFKTLKNNFIQISFCSILWFTFLISLFNFKQTIPFHYIWNIIGIGIIFGIVFGIIYPLLWNYLTLKASYNIVISSIVNTSCSLLAIKLFSSNWFNLVIDYWYLVLILTLILHTIVFYFYSKYSNKQLATTLNGLTK